MKITLKNQAKLTTITLVCGFMLATAFPAAAQELTPVSEPPPSGTFWLLSAKLNQQLSPPYPCDPYKGALPVYEMSGFPGQYVVGDSPEDFQRLQASGKSRAGRMSTLDSEGIPFPGGGDEGTNGYSYTPPPDIPNFAKYVGQSFSVIDTNVAAVNDTNLYNALSSFPDTTNTSPTLQILPYQSDCLLFKASHFDYSGETSRDFCLVVGDDLAAPLFKSIDLSNVNTNNGWLVQGSIPHWQASDTTYMMVSNISRVYNAFFRVIPYGGPTITLNDHSDYDIVSNTISIQADITDLSGVTQEGYELTVADLPARYTLGTNNTFNIETPYSPNGLEDVSLSVFNSARVFDTNNVPDNARLSFSGEQSVSLDFENGTFLAFASDYCPPDAGTNYVYYYVDQARHIEASILNPTNGQPVAAFSGDTSGATYITIPWDFTEADGVTPYSNGTYVVTFTASDISSPNGGIQPMDSGAGTTLTITNTIDAGGNIRPPEGCLLTYQWDDPSDTTGSYIDDKADQAIAGNLLTLYQDIYQSLSLTQYSPSDCGPNRNLAQCHPYNAEYKSWVGILSQLTNSYYSELTIAQAHGTGGYLGGAKYLTNTIDSEDLEKWVAHYSDGHHWRLRKATIFACYSADVHLIALGYPTWAEACGIRPTGMQENSHMYKNCGLFFGDTVENLYADNELGGNKTTAEIAAIVDITWVCGENQYSGGCDPTYSWWYACQTTINRFQDFNKTKPSLAGFKDCVYTSNQDEALRNLDISGVKQP